MIEVYYKMLNGLGKVAVGNIFVRDINVGRGHSFKLFKKRVQTQLRRRFLRIGL